MPTLNWPSATRSCDIEARSRKTRGRAILLHVPDHSLQGKPALWHLMAVRVWPKEIFSYCVLVICTGCESPWLGESLKSAGRIKLSLLFGYFSRSVTSLNSAARNSFPE